MKEHRTILYMVTLIENGGIEHRYFYTRSRAYRFTEAYGGFTQKVYAVSHEPLYYTDTKTGLTLEQLTGGNPDTVQMQLPCTA